MNAILNYRGDIVLLTRGNAQKIVDEMEEIINRSINIMDSHGYIIASTDKTRIGQFHEGAQKVIANKLTELVIENESGYEGSRRGVNLPILYNEDIIGVVGITGEPAEVSKQGQIIKKMTEILVLDSYIKEQGQLEDRTKSYFIEEWIFGNSHEEDRTFEVRGKLLGLDILKPRIVAVMYLTSRGEDKLEIEMQKIREKIIKDMKKEIEYNKDNIVISIGSKYIFLFNAKSASFVKEKMGIIKNKLESMYPVYVATGIGNIRTNHNEISQSYNEAEKALKVSLASKVRTIKIYEDINVELFIEEIPHRVKKEFIQKIFKNCNQKEIGEWMEILDVFFKHNGSINKAADELYIHKNTLQYRINKLIKKTGFDPRSTKDGLLLYLALLITRSDEN